MSIKSRLEKINKAAKTVTILPQNGWGIRGTVEGSKEIYFWSLKRLNNQVVKFGKREIGALVYRSNCYAKDGMQCKGNQHSYTVCYHIVAAYQESMRLNGFTVYKVNNANDAYKLLNLKCSFVKILSKRGGGAVTLAIKKTGSRLDAFSNLKELISDNRIALVNSGDKQPIANKVGVYLRRDGQLAFKFGYVTSGPVARFGRSWKPQSGAYIGEWKLTIDAEKNWQEFVRTADGIKPKVINSPTPSPNDFKDRVDLLRGKKEERYID